VFTTTIGTPLDPDNVSHYFKKAVKDAGLRPQRFHDLRHYADPGIMPTSAGEPRLVAVGRVPVSA
jgi:integrase